jgi:hypothetical protein
VPFPVATMNFYDKSSMICSVNRIFKNLYIMFNLHVVLLQRDRIFFFSLILQHAPTTKLQALNVMINLHPQLNYLHCCMPFWTSTDVKGDVQRPCADSVPLETILLIYSDH